MFWRRVLLEGAQGLRIGSPDGHLSSLMKSQGALDAENLTRGVRSQKKRDPIGIALWLFKPEESFVTPLVLSEIYLFSS
jgi:hypothetical protein